MISSGGAERSNDDSMKKAQQRRKENNTALSIVRFNLVDASLELPPPTSIHNESSRKPPIYQSKRIECPFKEARST